MNSKTSDPLPQSGDVREALKPFADAAADYDEIPGVCLTHGNVELWQQPRRAGYRLTVDHLRKAQAAYRALSLPAQGEADGLCELCSKPTESMSGNPALWPILLSAPDGTGIARFHHAGCVSNRVYIAATPDTAPDGVREMLDKFTLHYAPWMDGHGDEVECGTYSRHTFGDLRQARKLLKELGE